VQLINEEDDLAVGVGDFLQHGLEPLLELTAKLRASDQSTQIERDDLLVLQPFRHVAAHDALGQTLDDCRLPDAGLTDQDWVVLRPA
jgi:hypothetical protein